MWEVRFWAHAFCQACGKSNFPHGVLKKSLHLSDDNFDDFMEKLPDVRNNFQLNLTHKDSERGENANALQLPSLSNISIDGLPIYFQDGDNNDVLIPNTV